jgi:uncharacterized damage-inducible protein DinB
MSTRILSALIVRDLRALGRELQAYPTEQAIWEVPPGISNSAGTLAVHLVGNLQHFIGALLGGTGYVRDRDAEFAARGMARDELQRMIDGTIEVIEATLSNVTEAQLAEPFPAEVAGVRVRTDDFLTHLAVHLGYHLGQVDYHRRLVAAAGTVGAMGIPELATARPAAGNATS